MLHSQQLNYQAAVQDQFQIMFAGADPASFENKSYNTLDFPENLSFGAIQQNLHACSSLNYGGIINSYLQNDQETYAANKSISIECPKNSNFESFSLFGLEKDLSRNC